MLDAAQDSRLLVDFSKDSRRLFDLCAIALLISVGSRAEVLFDPGVYHHRHGICTLSSSPYNR
jgi:hypothetical protein